MIKNIKKPQSWKAPVEYTATSTSVLWNKKTAPMENYTTCSWTFDGRQLHEEKGWLLLKAVERLLACLPCCTSAWTLFLILLCRNLGNKCSLLIFIRWRVRSHWKKSLHTRVLDVFCWSPRPNTHFLLLTTLHAAPKVLWGLGAAILRQHEGRGRKNQVSVPRI